MTVYPALLTWIHLLKSVLGTDISRPFLFPAAAGQIIAGGGRIENILSRNSL
jgi:hypothetical protein